MESLLIISLILVTGILFGGISFYFSLNSLFKRHFNTGIIKWYKDSKNDPNRYRKTILWLQKTDENLFQIMKNYLFFIEISIVLLTINTILALIIFLHG